MRGAQTLLGCAAVELGMAKFSSAARKMQLLLTTDYLQSLLSTSPDPSRTFPRSRYDLLHFDRGRPA